MVGDSQLTSPEYIRDTTEKIVQIKNHLLTTHSRQKSYVDKRVKPLEFEVSDMVLLKILAIVGPVAYTLEWPEELKGIHSTFHVSNQKKCLAEGDVVVPLDEIQLDDKLHVIEEPVEVVDREETRLKDVASFLAAAAEEKQKRGHVLSYLTMGWSKKMGKQLEGHIYYEKANRAKSKEYQGLAGNFRLLVFDIINWYQSPWLTEMQMQKKKYDRVKQWMLILVVTDSMVRESKKHDTNSRSGNDTHAEDAYIKPVNYKELMAEVQMTAEYNVFPNGQ
ncbi:hypothetical protein Tco_0729144 [Tanacetum coccineum]|uniref:Tf2-1-like SH3-like domain-containing protein n=1 Tax=Tanacetum coccineum TaxID=301880 RepID=A0ABQ4YR76_9ASTR